MPIDGSFIGKFQDTLATMEIGEEGFTYPAALSLLERRGSEGAKYVGFLHTGFPVYQQKSDSMEMYVKRIAQGTADDFYVNVDAVKNYKWTPGFWNNFSEGDSGVVNIGEITVADGMPPRPQKPPADQQ